MSVDIMSLVMQPTTVGPVMAGVGALASAALGSTFLIPPITRRLMPLPKETRLADFLPFETMMDDGRTIEMQNGGLCIVIKLKGAELLVASQGEYEMHFQSRRHWLNQLAEKKIKVRAFTIRTAIAPGKLAEHPVPHMRQLANKWEKSFEDSSFYTDHYVVLSSDAKDVIVMDEAATITKASLEAFGPEILTTGKGESPLQILARLASPITRPQPKPFPGARVSEQITSDIIHFADDRTGLITVFSGTKKRYMSVVGIKTFGDFTEERMMVEMASLPFEYTVFHYIEPLPRTKATTTMDMQYRLARTNLMTETSQAQFDRVNELISGGGEDTQVICKYGLHFIVEADTIEELNKRLSQISTVASQYEVTTVREGHVSQAVWFAQFPTHDTLPRPWVPLSANVATLLGFQRTIKGAERSPLGEGPVTILKTASGAPYNFVFHDMSDPSNKEPLGHTFVVGPSGSGKTFIISWLATMAARFPDLRLFFFDRYNGTEVVTRLFGGKYVTFDGGGAGMNPLQMELNDVNVDFLKTWLEQITDLHDDKSKEQFGQALKYLEMAPSNLRNLKHLFQSAFPAESPTKSAMRPWVSDSQNGHVFCADRDSLDLNNRMVSFDFTQILSEERKDNLGPAVVSYIMHRTMDVASRQQKPSIYFVDETAPLLRNEFFANKFASGLQEGRKLGQVFICAFQRPNAITETPHAQMILGQCVNQIFFRNNKAKAEDFDVFGMNERELRFVLGQSHGHLPRAFLLRRMLDGRSESVIIDADMSVLGTGMKTFASGYTNVNLIRKLAEEDPENFRELYNQRMIAEQLAA